MRGGRGERDQGASGSQELGVKAEWVLQTTSGRVDGSQRGDSFPSVPEPGLSQRDDLGSGKWLWFAAPETRSHSWLCPSLATVTGK